MPATYNFGSLPTGPSMTSYDTRILAQSGPLTPRVNLPLAVYELKDLPEMLKHAGDLLHKLGRRPVHHLKPAQEAASATLAWQFGWGPLLQDLSKMCDFADAVKRKQQQLMKAQTNQGIKQRVNLDEYRAPQNGDEVVWSVFGLNLKPKYYGYKSYETWATIRWKIRDVSQIGRVPTFQDSFRAALGLNPGMIPIDVWKALPWSWAVDWFLDISNHLLASYNQLYYKPSGMCVMRHSKNEWFYSPIQVGQKLYLTAAHIIHEEKRRIVRSHPNTSLNLRLPFLDSFKLSILGSFTILKLRR
nr:MAG: hypothetical protein 1 [Leviviridae sp.]